MEFNHLTGQIPPLAHLDALITFTGTDCVDVLVLCHINILMKSNSSRKRVLWSIGNFWFRFHSFYCFLFCCSELQLPSQRCQRCLVPVVSATITCQNDRSKNHLPSLELIFDLVCLATSSTASAARRRVVALWHRSISTALCAATTPTVRHRSCGFCFIFRKLNRFRFF